MRDYYRVLERPNYNLVMATDKASQGLRGRARAVGSIMRAGEQLDEVNDGGAALPIFDSRE